MKLSFFMPKISLPKLRRSILIVFVVAAIFSGGYFLGASGFKTSLTKFPKVTITREVPPNKTSIDFSLFWRVWDILGSKYYDKTKLNPGKMVYGAISGMVSALGDPYTVFLPPEENKVVQEDLNGSFEGVGIQIGFKGTQLAVMAPLPDSPAERAGVQAGDFIIGIKDEAKSIDRGTVGISLPEAVQAIRGRAGSKVTLTLLRDASTEPMVVELVRESLEVPTLILTYVGETESIAHIRLLKFGAETDSEWQKVVKEILAKGSVKGVVLDLRNNPGGYLQGAVDVASEFLKNGSTVVVEQKGDGSRNDFVVERIGYLTNMPTIVLVNEGSASASEILAGALRDVRNIKLVGDKTFGKGTIQEPQELDSGSGLHITIAKWLTPSGTWVNEKGLEPDFAIEDDTTTTEDEQLLKAVEILQGRQ
jgi:carboxyl-terminal processing protease